MSCGIYIWDKFYAKFVVENGCFCHYYFALNMVKKKRLSHDQRIINALEKIQSPIFDKRHNLFIYFINNLVIIKMLRVEMCDHYSCN